MKEYTYRGDLWKIKTDDVLQEEGVLSGEFGNLHYRLCEDGLSIIDSHFPGSGFVYPPASINLLFPKTVNDIPVTEIHMHLQQTCEKPVSGNLFPAISGVAIEGGTLKRVYLDFSPKNYVDMIKENDDINKVLVLLLLQAEKEKQKKEDILQIRSIKFYNNDQHVVDYCEIHSGITCVLEQVDASTLKVISPVVLLDGKASENLKHVSFSGSVFPVIYPDWDCDRPSNGYFSELHNLETVDGSLNGESGWLFSDCVSLKSVHLSNGIKKIPPYSFKNCCSIVDIYVPDTVTQIGEYAFSGCTQLRTIHLPSDIRTIPRGMCMNCCSLTKVFLSDCITAIEDEAFIGCSLLRKPWIPKNIQKIGENAFDNPEWGIF